MSEHTKEPWEHEGTLVFIGRTVGGFDLRDCPAPEANARRIVACVNACAGMTTEEIENDIAVGGYIAIVKCHQAHIEEIEKKRDELLSSLKSIKPVMVRVSKTSLERVAVYPADEIDAAIAKVKS